MTKELAYYLVRALLYKHPLPWRLEFDWTVEVTDAKDKIIVKLRLASEGDELIALANEVAAYDAQGKRDVEKLMREFGIED